jgi:hemoglobin
MPDIETRTDLELLMVNFYGKVLLDPVIGHFFTEVVKLDMDKHIPVIVDFWESVVMEKGSYQGNVLAVHERLHHLSAFRDAHFERWVMVFKETVDELFTGTNAEKLKQRATSIATVMKIKLVHGGIGLQKG